MKCPLCSSKPDSNMCQLVHIEIPENKRYISIRYKTQSGKTRWSDIYLGIDGKSERIKREILNFVDNFTDRD